MLALFLSPAVVIVVYFLDKDIFALRNRSIMFAFFDWGAELFLLQFAFIYLFAFVGYVLRFWPFLVNGTDASLISNDIHFFSFKHPLFSAEKKSA